MPDQVMSARPILERFSLIGRVALVTGAGQGIGRAFAHALGEAGAAVAVVDINAEFAEKTAAELHGKSIDSLALVADVTKRSDVTRMVARVVEKWGSLTIAVNNAGKSIWVDSELMTDESWHSLMALNLDAVFSCSQEEAKAMFRSGYGKIINTASMSAHIINTPQKQSAYNVSKAGVLHMTRSLAAEWAPRGIRVNSISPGYTTTPLVEKLLATPEGQAIVPEWLKRVPAGRMADVTDLQGAVVFLASEVSDYMTGSDIIIDGGYCTW
jgi:NAD(P)-dependent dehydrogenase (short-subunit alcohol dehydrogenase family)